MARKHTHRPRRALTTVTEHFLSISGMLPRKNTSKERAPQNGLLDEETKTTTKQGGGPRGAKREEGDGKIRQYLHAAPVPAFVPLILGSAHLRPRVVNSPGAHTHLFFLSTSCVSVCVALTAVISLFLSLHALVTLSFVSLGLMTLREKHTLPEWERADNQ